MATIVCGGALSHSPLMNRTADEIANSELIARFRSSARAMGQRVNESRPDVVIVFGPDHFRTLFYDLLPAFLIGTGDVQGWGDWNTPTGPFRTHPELARHIHTELLDEDFDPASSRDLKVDHGITQAVELLGIADLPIIPILINCAAPPLPTPLRCFVWGAAVARAVRSYGRDLNVAIVGSGGLSHDPPLPAIDSANPETVRQAVHGRDLGFSQDREREERLVKRVRELSGGIQERWDREVLEAFGTGTVGALADDLSTESILKDAGRGGQEVRTWIAVSGALGDPAMEQVFYEPIPALITGMGAVFYDARAHQSAENEI